MRTWLWELWTDSAKFTALARALVFGLAAMAQQGAIPGAGTAKGWWLTFLVQTLAIATPARTKSDT